MPSRDDVMRTLMTSDDSEAISKGKVRDSSQ